MAVQRKQALDGVPNEPLAARLIDLFRALDRDRLDLHLLFEAAGNDPTERIAVLDAIDQLLLKGLIEPAGADFFQLTAKGKNASGS